MRRNESDINCSIIAMISAKPAKKKDNAYLIYMIRNFQPFKICHHQINGNNSYVYCRLKNIIRWPWMQI
jgi:hypothetical protein